MCVIVDTNTFGPVFDKKNDKHKDFKPVLDWVLHGKGKFIIGGSKYVGELKKAKRYLKLFQLLATHKGKVIKLNDSKVDAEQKRIESLVVDSDFDDPHLPAMVIVSRCQVICSADTRSIRFVTDPKLYPAGIKNPKYYTSCRNCDLLSDKYVDSKYKPIKKMPQNTAAKVEANINTILGDIRK